MYTDGNLGRSLFVSLAGRKFLSTESRHVLTGNHSVFSLGLGNGGPAGLVYGFIICWIGTVCLFCSLAEMASA